MSNWKPVYTRKLSSGITLDGGYDYLGDPGAVASLSFQGHGKALDAEQLEELRLAIVELQAGPPKVEIPKVSRGFVIERNCQGGPVWFFQRDEFGNPNYHTHLEQAYVYKSLYDAEACLKVIESTLKSGQNLRVVELPQ